MRSLAVDERVELVDRGADLAELRSQRRIELALPHPAGVDELDDRLDEVALVEGGVLGHRQDLERIEPPRAGGQRPHEGDVIDRVRDRAHALLEVADLRRREQRQATDDGVRDVLLAQPRDDRLAVLVLAVQDGDVVPALRVADERLDRVDDRDRLVVGPAAGVDLDRLAVGSLGPKPLVGQEPELVGLDQPVRAGQHMADAPEVLFEPESRRRSGRGRRRVMRRRSGEARVELGEGGEAGASESIDRLVVVADDHDVVGSIGRATEQLDQLDLGDVGVLELVDQDVSDTGAGSGAGCWAGS